MEPKDIYCLLKRTPSYLKNTFYGTFIIGILTHIYAITNKFPNMDDVSDFSGIGGGAVFQGRWLLGILSDVRKDTVGDFSMPGVKGIVALLFISVTACILIELFEITSAVQGIMLGGILITFPTIAMNYAYMYLADYFGFSIFLAALAVLVAVKWKHSVGVFGGMIILACSLGIYQAYFPFCAVLFLIVLIQETISDIGYKDILKSAFSYFFTLSGGMILYFIINKMFLYIFNADTVSMHGSTMGDISLADLPIVFSNIIMAWKQLILSDYLGVSSNVGIRIIIISLICIMGGFLLYKAIEFKKEKEYIKAILIVAEMLMFPITINLIYIMVPKAAESIYILMAYALVGIFITPIVIYNYIARQENKKWIAKATEWISVICIILGIGNYAYQSNIIYIYGDITHQSAVAYYSTIISQIKDTEGYSEEIPTAFIGKVQDKTLASSYEIFSKQLSGISGIGGNTNREIILGSNFYEYMELYCGFAPITCTDEEVEALKKTEDFKRLPCYPNKGSIAIIDGKMVVKLSEEE